MSKLNRILWSGLVLGIAACGDSVTVTQPPEPVPGIRSVTVAPDGAQLAVGATLQMTAAVTTDPGADAPTYRLELQRRRQGERWRDLQAS